MSRLTLTFVLVGALTTLVGCASAPAPQVTAIDGEQMAAIEKHAARSGVRVIWVNPPEKRLP